MRETLSLLCRQSREIKLNLILLTVLSILLSGLMSEAQGDALMPKEYRAEWVGDTGGKIHVVYYVSGGNTRRQNAPGTAATNIKISNMQENITYEIDVLNKVYTELPYHPEIINDSRIQYARKNEKEKTARLKLVGTETINNQVCDIYRETSLTTYPYETTYWVSRTYGIPIKIIYRSKNLSTNQMVETKQEWFVKPGHQPANLFTLPPGYKRKEAIAFASVADDSVISSNKLFGRPANIHTALCEDQQIHKIKYVARHLAKPDCKTPNCKHNETYDEFEFIEKPLKSGMCLIGDDGYFFGKTVVQFRENKFPEDTHQRPACEQNVITIMEKTLGLPIKGCWRLGKYGAAGTYNIAEFMEKNSVRSAALSLYDGRRLVLNNWSVKIPSEAAPDVWRLGDEGVFHPEENFVLFGLTDGSEMELVTLGFGGEGITYSLKRTDGNSFTELMNEYIYTAGY